MPPKSHVIALEEHYQDDELKQHRGGGVAERLDDVGALRLKEMDEAGIDLQVLSHANPGGQVTSEWRIPEPKRPISSHRVVAGGGGERGTTTGRRTAGGSRTAP